MSGTSQPIPRGQMTSSRKTVLRLVVAAMLAIPSVAISVSSSSAAPSKAQVEAAKAKLDALNRQLDLMVEQYNQAQVRLQQTQAKLARRETGQGRRRRHHRPCHLRAVQARGRGVHGDGIAARRAPGGRELHGVLRPPPVHGGARAGRRRPRRAGADREPEVAVGGAAVRPGRDGAPGHAGRAREPEEPDRGRHLRPGGAVLPDEHQLQERARRAGGGRGRGRGKLLVAGRPDRAGAACSFLRRTRAPRRSPSPRRNP